MSVDGLLNYISVEKELSDDWMANHVKPDIHHQGAVPDNVWEYAYHAGKAELLNELANHLPEPKVNDAGGTGNND